MAAVKNNSKWGYLNSSGDITIKPQYEHANSFTEGLALVLTILSGIY